MGVCPALGRAGMGAPTARGVSWESSPDPSPFPELSSRRERGSRVASGEGVLRVFQACVLTLELYFSG